MLSFPSSSNARGTTAINKETKGLFINKSKIILYTWGCEYPPSLFSNISYYNFIKLHFKFQGQGYIFSKKFKRVRALLDRQ